MKNIKKIKIFDGTNWVEYTLDGAAIDNAVNLEVGSKPGATQTKDATWNGGEQKDEENIIRVQDGDTVEGAIADGFQSVAFGGARYDKFRKNDKESKQVPTAVYGNQSFAAGGNVYVHGDFSAGFGKDVNAYQRCAFVMGGGAQAGRTKEEFEDRLKVVTGVNGIIAPMYTTINVTENGDLVDSDSIIREYAGATYAYDGYDSASGQFKYKLKIVLTNDVCSPPENITLDAEEVAKLPYSDYEGKPYNISYSFATAFGGSKAWGRGSFGMGGGLAYGDYTLAGGTGSLAYEDNSIAFGERVHAAGVGSVAFGEGSSSSMDTYGLDRNYGALGKYSAHFGRLNKARGNYSFVIGNSNTVAGMYSFASGSLNIVNGNNQFAHGVGLITGSSKDGQVIFGKYNNTSYINSMIFAIGNGTSDSDRKNLLTLYQDGRLRLSNNFEVELTPNDVPRLQDVQKVVNTEIAKVVDSAPEAFDTLKEVANWITDDESGAAAMANEIAQLKQDVDQVELDLASIELNTSKIIISNTVKTQYNIGTVNGAFGNPQELFKEGETLQQAFERIYTGPTTPGSIKSNPNLTLTLSHNSVSGEIGTGWPTITTSTSTTAGSYTYGPNTGVTWIGDANITFSGNTNGIIGEGSRTYTATQSYNAATAKAKDSMGNTPEDAVSIIAGSDSDEKTVSETVLYRQFYGFMEGTVDTILANLKNVQLDTSEIKTYLQNSNPNEISVNIPDGKTGYIYFITKHTINGATMGGFEFPISKIGTETFTNYYNASYSVNIYRSSSEQTEGTYTIKLS